MAVYDLEEQEKIDSIKAWWKAQGTLILILIAAFVENRTSGGAL